MQHPNSQFTINSERPRYSERAHADQPSNVDSVACARRRRIEDHQERMRCRKERELNGGWYE